MKVLVPIKRVVDPYVKIRIKADNTGVELANVKMVINPFDEIAIEEAVRWKEAGLITEIVVVTIADEVAKDTLGKAGVAAPERRGEAGAISVVGVDHKHQGAAQVEQLRRDR